MKTNFNQLLTEKHFAFFQVFFKKTLSVYGLIAAIFVLVIILEYSTQSAYVFGYLYTGAILLANYHLSRPAVVCVTIAATALTLLNIIIPISAIYDPVTLANRLIAVMALILTAWLSDRNRLYQGEIVRQQTRIEAQEQLARIREDFVSTLTHDLKTPILGAIETLKALNKGHFGLITESQQQVLEMITQSHQSTLQLVEMILDIYRNDTEGITLKCSPVNLTTLIENLIATMTELAQSRRIHINLNFGESNTYRPLWVNGDFLQLQRVFTNLLVNAINHSTRGSKVEVVLQSLGTIQQVLILDNGLGITEAELPQLFERFYQGHSNRQAKGVGLGLYLSRQIVTAHHGKIWAENRVPQGALFGCQLPALSVTSSHNL